MTKDRNNYPGPERRTENGNGSSGVLAGLPMWARIITVLGATGTVCTISLYLVYTGGQAIPDIQLKQGVILEQNRRLEDLINEHIVSNRQLIRIMQQVCVGVNRSDPAREAQCYNQ